MEIIACASVFASHSGLPISRLMASVSGSRWALSAAWYLRKKSARAAWPSLRHAGNAVRAASTAASICPVLHGARSTTSS